MRDIGVDNLFTCALELRMKIDLAHYIQSSALKYYQSAGTKCSTQRTVTYMVQIKIGYLTFTWMI